MIPFIRSSPTGKTNPRWHKSKAVAVNATPNIEKSNVSTAQCHVRSRCVVSDRALNNEDAGKIGTSRTPRPVRRLPRAKPAETEPQLRRPRPRTSPSPAPSASRRSLCVREGNGSAQSQIQKKLFLRRKKRPFVFLLSFNSQMYPFSKYPGSALWR